ncbi:hypothetical protein K4H04_23200, partial [Mycobacterium tuberculosis]|nr:hypothetical protein [Mycobacterium tuberculosis]
MSPSAIVLGCIGRRIVPPDENQLDGLYRPPDEGASVAGSRCFGGGGRRPARDHSDVNDLVVNEYERDNGPGKMPE